MKTIQDLAKAAGGKYFSKHSRAQELIYFAADYPVALEIKREAAIMRPGDRVTLEIFGNGWLLTVALAKK